jgi:DNA-binding MurR/RpiR family transcriptional regulator
MSLETVTRFRRAVGFFDFPEFRTKLLELLKEVVPSLSKIAVIWDPNSGPA